MSVLVVGGGITGLAAAHALAPRRRPGHARRGRPAARRQDRARSASTASSSSTGPDSFLATGPAAIALARELGLGDDAHRDARPAHGLHPHRRRAGADARGDGPRPADPDAAVREDAAVLAGPRSSGWRSTSSRRGGSAAEDVAVGHVPPAPPRRSPLVDRLAGPLVGGVYGTPIDELSLDAVVPQLRDGRARPPEPAVRGARRRARDAARSGGEGGCARRLRPPSPGLPVRWGRAAGRLRLAPGRDGPADRRARRLGVGRPARSCGPGARCGPSPEPGSGVAARLSDGSAGPVRRRDHRRPRARRGASSSTDELPGASAALDTIPHGTSILVTLAYPREPRRPRRSSGTATSCPPTEGGADRAPARGRREKWPDRAPDDTRPAADVRPRRGGLDAACPTRPSSPPPATTRSGRCGSPASRSSCAPRAGSSAMPRYTVGHLRRVAAIEAAVGGVAGRDGRRRLVPGRRPAGLRHAGAGGGLVGGRKPPRGGGRSDGGARWCR